MMKTHSVYQVKNPEELTIRDYLAKDRTELALERTLLSYIRTFLGLFGAGTACIKLIADSQLLYYLGYVFVLASPLFLILGICRYAGMRKRLQAIPENHLLVPSGGEKASKSGDPGQEA